jgi:unsaturated rhamnogalacturonyl hydrolase
MIRIIQGLFLTILFGLLNLHFTNTCAQDTSRYSIKMAESIMQWRPSGYSGWDYVTGTVLKGFEELWRVTGDERYFTYIKKTVDNVVNDKGEISGYRKEDYNLDEIREGCQLLLLYKQTGEKKYHIAANLLREQLEEHPRTNSGGFWHKERYPWQMWLDGLYMGSPFYAEYSKLFGYTNDFEDVMHQITEMDAHAYDDSAKLYYHGWDESREQDWADPVTGTSPSFWGRAIGWYAMAIVDVLDYLPQDHPGRDSVLNIFNRLAQGVALYQDPDSLVWWQVVDQMKRDSNYIESSASCMFVYALAKGVRLGYLDNSFKDVILSGYQGILDHFIEPELNGTINLTSTCLTAGLGYGRDGSYAYYTTATPVVSNDGKALGPFILASIEIEMMDSIYPPGNLLADTLLFEGPVMNWFDNSDKETGFLMERKDQDSFFQIADLPAGITTYTDTSVESMTQYSYRVRAYNTSDTSRYSNVYTLTTLYRNGQPLPAENPNPANGSIMVSHNQILSWESGRFASSHDIYFGTTDPPPFIGNFQVTSWSPPELEKGITYYWRIDEMNENGTTEGPVWSFTTDPATALDNRYAESTGTMNPIIHPNPAENYIMIKLPDGTDTVSVLMYDAAGKLVKKVQVEDKNFAENQMIITTNNLPDGIYYLNILSRGRTDSGRVLISR